MKNSVDVQTEFSFKGEDYLCSATLDLDELLQQHDDLPVIHELLAHKHGIDTYSYLYEVMLEAELEFSNPQGLVAQYMQDGKLDLSALDWDWGKHKAQLQIQAIATEEMGIHNLDEHPGLQRALLDAYNLGKKA
ncbi:MAG: hypothetical protein PHH47_04265 [Gallionella sp.]|nr:hypothetical protein [Gallionella sp.]MDD4945610.1 hypothetical protein [Gallionella sp.]